MSRKTVKRLAENQSVNSDEFIICGFHARDREPV